MATKAKKETVKRVVELGHVAADRVTGFTGTVIAKEEALNGNVRFGLQPKCKPGEEDKYPTAEYLDYHMLEFVSEGIADTVQTPNALSLMLELGTQVQDRASGIVGVAISRNIFHNGCVYYNVVPEKLDKPLLSGVPPSDFLSAERLQPYVAPVSKKPVKEKLAIPQTKAGGPSTTLRRDSVRRG